MISISPPAIRYGMTPDWGAGGIGAVGTGRDLTSDRRGTAGQALNARV